MHIYQPNKAAKDDYQQVLMCLCNVCHCL